MAYISFKPQDYFNTKIYTGTGSTQSITGVGFQPDLLWIKGRQTGRDHFLCDAARGSTKVVHPNLTNVETTAAGDITSLDSDGFTIGSTDSNGEVNEGGSTENKHVSWNWKAGTTSGITTTGADITPSAYSFNHTSRISIAAYTGNGVSGAKIAHGLGAIPEVMIIKSRDYAGRAWIVYHHKNTAAPETDYLTLNTSDATADGAWAFNDAVPTSVYMETQSNTGTNNSGSTYILYTFKGVQGYSKFGSYTGNGNADGTFVYTGFKPAFVMCKYTGAENWAIVDNQRLGYNVANYQLYANATNAEVTNVRMDILSNGFKARTTNAEWNGSGNSYIYMAFAEQPSVGSNGTVGVAR